MSLWHQDLIAPAAGIIGGLAGAGAAGLLATVRDRSTRRHADAAAERQRLRTVSEEAIVALHDYQEAAHHALLTAFQLRHHRQAHALMVDRNPVRAARVLSDMEEAAGAYARAQQDVQSVWPQARQLEERLRLHVHPKHPIFVTYSAAVHALGSLLVAVGRGEDETVDPAWPRMQMEHAVQLRDGSEQRREAFAAAVRAAVAVEPPPERRSLRQRAHAGRLDAAFRYGMWRARRAHRKTVRAGEAPDPVVEVGPAREVD